MSDGKFWGFAGGLSIEGHPYREDATAENLIASLLSDSVVGSVKGEHTRFYILETLMKSWNSDIEYYDISYSFDNEEDALSFYTGEDKHSYGDIGDPYRSNTPLTQRVVLYKGRRFLVGCEDGLIEATPVKLKMISSIKAVASRSSTSTEPQVQQKIGELRSLVYKTALEDVRVSQLVRGEGPQEFVNAGFHFNTRVYADGEILLITNSNAPDMTLYLNQGGKDIKDDSLKALLALSNPYIFKGEKVLWAWHYMSDGETVTHNSGEGGTH